MYASRRSSYDLYGPVTVLHREQTQHKSLVNTENKTLSNTILRLSMRFLRYITANCTKINTKLVLVYVSLPVLTKSNARTLIVLSHSKNVTGYIGISSVTGSEAESSGCWSRSLYCSGCHVRNFRRLNLERGRYVYIARDNGSHHDRSFFLCRVYRLF